MSTVTIFHDQSQKLGSSDPIDFRLVALTKTHQVRRKSQKSYNHLKLLLYKN